MKITVKDQTFEVKQGTSYREIAQMVQDQYRYDIVLVKSDTLKELHKHPERDETIEFLTTADKIGNKTYERGVLMLLTKAIYDVVDRKAIHKVLVKFSLIHGYYVEIKGDVVITQELVDRVKARMREMVEADTMIRKKSVSVRKAREAFRRAGLVDKDRLLRYRRSSSVNLYYLDDYVDYYYGFMVPSTGYLRYFDLLPYEDGLALLTPKSGDPESIPPFNPQPKLFRALQNSSEWSERMNIATIGEINDKISRGEIADLILMAEARQESEIAAIATKIAAQPSKKCVMIAGPSSSGKTSFSHRLSVQLRGLGLTPHPIAVDNYFVNHDQTPVDENGEYDFESIKAVAVEDFNRDINRLLAGECVEMPTFNFKKGEREYHGNTLQIGENDILVIEGIHCLNDELSYEIPAENKFKIYISALVQTNVDEHNRIPTSDGRLLRRMVRDARTRGTGARETISRWPSVRRGEENNIFPYQESADAVFNSSLVYEQSVLKSYAEQLLFGIPEDAEEYQEAKRLLKFLDYFLAVDSTLVPQNSLLKEFIGGSIFNVG